MTDELSFSGSVDELRFDISSPALMVLTPPLHHCVIHGEHSSWVTFPFIDPCEQYCMKCVGDTLKKLGITTITTNTEGTQNG